MNAPVQISPREAVTLGATSLITYGKLFFPRTFRQESPTFHSAIATALYSHERYNAFSVFRGGAKTSLLRVYGSQRIAYAISRTIGWVSVSQLHAKFSVRWLRRQVEYNRRWADAFGLRPGKKWTDEWCEIVCNLVRDDQGNPLIITVLALGITGQIRGFNPDDFRFDLLLMDDVLDDENSATIDQRKKIEDLIFGALLKSLAPASESPLAKAVFLQTPMNRDDAMEKCMADPQWNGLRFSCFDDAGQSRWEQRLPTDELLKEKEAHIRRSQYRLWMREMECQIVSGEEKALDITRLKYYEVLPESLDAVISLDPASSESPDADEFAVAAVGFKGNDVYLLDYACERGMMPDAVANNFFNLMLLYHPRKGVCESNGYQRIAAWYLEQEMRKRKLFLPVSRLEVRTKNSDRIMQTLPGLMAFGHLFVRPTHTKFIQQADDYDPQVRDIADDLLTAVANAIVECNPALRASMVEDPVSGHLVLDETEYKAIDYRGSP